MKLKYIIISIAIVLILIAGYFWIEKKDYAPIDRINPNLPDYFLYANEKDIIPDKFLAVKFTTIEDIFEDELIYKKKDDWVFYCKSNSEPAVKIEYFYHNIPYLEGAWSYRYAYVCGSKYYIFDARNAGGIKLFGPFDAK